MTPKQGRQRNSWRRKLDKGRLYIPREIASLFRAKIFLVEYPDGILLTHKIPPGTPKERVLTEPIQENPRGEKRILIPASLRKIFLFDSHGEILLVREDHTRFLLMLCR